jgi:DNA-binding MarR family transcriptional regulator
MKTTTAARFYSGPEEGETSADTLARALLLLEIGHRRLRTEFGATLGLTNSEFNALTNIGHSRELTPKELSSNLHMTTGAVTAMIDRLENAGLVARRNNPNDRRSVLIAPTERGYETLDWVVQKYRGAIVKIVEDRAEFRHPLFAELLHNVGQSLARQAEELAQETAQGHRTP